MARTLDANLLAAQANQSRYPIAEIISSQRESDIPFDGTLLTSETFDEYGVNMVAHSSGRLVMAYIYYNTGTSISGLKFVYTDTGRTVFTTVDLPLYSYGSNEIIGVSIAEMTGGNVGLVLLVNDKSNHLYRLTRRIYTVTGTAVSNAEIANWSHDTFTSDPWVQTIGTDSYLLVYGKISGSDYYIYKRTSSDFLTWSAESALSIGGLTSTWKLRNPSIVKVSTGDLWLWFDVLESTGPSGEELTNIYYSVSADSGSTWANAVKVTAYTTYGEVGSHPVAVQKVANQMHLLFTRKVGALHMEDSASGWPTGDCTTELSWDSVNRKLYAVNAYNWMGSKFLENITKIDVDTWTVDTYWDSTTSPGFPSWICDGTHHIWFECRIHDKHMIAIMCVASGHCSIWVLDGEANTITPYHFLDIPAHSVTANCTGWPSVDYTEITGLHMDADNNKLWIVLVDTYIWHQKINMGYLDLTESAPYQYHQVVSYNTDMPGYQFGGVTAGGSFWYDVDNAILLYTFHGAWGGGLMVFDADSGALLNRWQGNGDDADFPYKSITHCTYYNGCVYAGLYSYESGYGQQDFRGLVEINLSTEIITYYRPTYCSDDDHAFGRPFHLYDGKLAMTHNGYGLAVFDTVSKTWQLYSNTTLSGMTVTGAELSAGSQAMYDSVNEMIMVGDAGLGAAHGVIMFSINGFIRQGYYAVGSNPGAGWSFGTPAQLVIGYVEYDPAAAVEPGSSTSMYVFWTNEDNDAEKSMKWDKDGSTVDLSSYLLRGTEITTERTIEGKPATLTFTVTHGHLFDPYNASSLLNMVLKKGRKLTLRFGENISGTEYWENQGTFYVTGAKMSFQRGSYPTMSVEAEDGRAMWAHASVLVTEEYNNAGEDILEDLMVDVANMDLADIDFPSMGGPAFQIQWIDTTLDEIVTQICNRLGYFFRFDMDGKASARVITNVAALDHTYTGNNDLFNYSPDDKYSDFTNQVTVQGQELDFTQVLFNEERIAQLSGTIGWWGAKKEHVVWFSDDKSRRCMNPRINVIETSTSMPYQLAGPVTEYLEECESADDYKFCTVYVDAPDLTPQLITAIGMVGTGLAIGDYAPPVGGMTIPIGKILEKAGLIWALMILASTANYQIEVWAQPVGSIRRSVQATWDDTVHQTEIGAVVPAVITDPLCYSVADCTQVAAFEGMVVQMQRKRVTITKMAHLQDEEGDTIRRVHPYSGQNIDLFIASLKRTMVIPVAPGDSGTFCDEIEGWVIS